MPHLYVSVRLNGAVADQRLCHVRDEVWLGSAPAALVAFPGPAIRVRSVGGALQVQGRWLRPGTQVRMARGELEVTLEAVAPAQRTRRADWVVPDLRVLVASLAVVLMGAWFDAVGAFLERHPGAVASLTHGLRTELASLGWAADLDDGTTDDTGAPCYGCGGGPEERPPVAYRPGE